MGNSIKQIADILGRTDKTISTYIRSYQEQGIDGLVMKFSTSPPRLTTEQQEQLKQTIIGSLPHELGFPAKFN